VFSINFDTKISDNFTSNTKLFGLIGERNSVGFTATPNVVDAIDLWDRKGYKIILTTGRKESLRDNTEAELKRLGIVYDQLVMGLGGGDRIIINDKKDNGECNTCYAVNLVRNKGLNLYNFDNKYVTISDEQPKAVEKPWGKEELIEYNDKYVVKKLFMKKGECCSMQYHEIKRETIYVLSGKLRLYIGKTLEELEVREMIAGDTINIAPYTIHRMEGIEDSYYLESSSNELWDVVRVQDKYSRANEVEKDYKL
jgi:mannose-6-phosphate isomerase-like protein (cupin superfamily)